MQSPLPEGMGPDAEQVVFDTIDPAKDVDGFTPVNVGLLVQNRARLVPCTPRGVIELLRRSGIELKGARAVVLGRSDIVGKPMAMLLLHEHATVTICHSRTKDLPSVVREADLVVVAIGRTAFVQPEWVKPGATVIDVGTNRVTDAGGGGSTLPARVPAPCGFRQAWRARSRATSIPPSRRWPERSRRCRAGWVR